MEGLISALWVGFVMALCTVLPPGLLNMSAARWRLESGLQAARWFMLGAVLVIGLQTALALWSARYMKMHPNLMFDFQILGLSLVMVLGLYFFLRPKTPIHAQTHEADWGRSRPFWSGMSLAILNLLPFPFYVMSSLSLSHTPWFRFAPWPMSGFTLGVMSGSFSVFSLYTAAFRKWAQKRPIRGQQFDRWIGLMLVLAGLGALVKSLL